MTQDPSLPRRGNGPDLYLLQNESPSSEKGQQGRAQVEQVTRWKQEPVDTPKVEKSKVRTRSHPRLLLWLVVVFLKVVRLRPEKPAGRALGRRPRDRKDGGGPEDSP